MVRKESKKYYKLNNWWRTPRIITTKRRTADLLDKEKKATTISHNQTTSKVSWCLSLRIVESGRPILSSSSTMDLTTRSLSSWRRLISCEILASRRTRSTFMIKSRRQWRSTESTSRRTDPTSHKNRAMRAVTSSSQRQSCPLLL